MNRALHFLLLIVIASLLLVLPTAAQATVFQTNTETPADEGPAAEATAAPADTVGDVVDDLVNTGEGVVLAWLAGQALNIQTIVIVVVIAGLGVFLAVVGGNVVVTRRLAQMVDKAVDQAREAAKQTETPWDDRFLDVVKAVAGVILQVQSQSAGPVVLTGAAADVIQDEAKG